MQRPMCWICAIFGAAIALAVFAASSSSYRPILASVEALMGA
jgi:hypothetical protein